MYTVLDFQDHSQKKDINVCAFVISSLLCGLYYINQILGNSVKSEPLNDNTDDMLPVGKQGGKKKFSFF